MSDSNNKNTDDPFDKFDEDLDEMLQGAADETVNDELLDDEDTIDRLLMGDDSNAVQSLNQDSPQDSDNKQDTSLDEFADLDELIDSEIDTQQVTDRSQEQGQADRETNQKPDGFETKGDAFSDTADADGSFKNDFDISSDDEDLLLIDEMDSQSTTEPIATIERSTIQSEQSEDELEIEVAESPADEDLIELDSTLQTDRQHANKVDIEQFELLKEHVTLIETEYQNTNQQLMQANDTIEQNSKKLHKLSQLEKTHAEKQKTFAFIALAIAIIALLISGLMGAIHLGLQSDINELTEMVTDMEESVEDLSAATKDKNRPAFAALKNSIALTDSRLDHLGQQLLQLKSNSQNEQASATTLNEADQIKLTGLADNIELNNNKLNTLQNALAKLQKSKVKSSRVAKKRSKSATKEWTVNLVSFKQEWYANKKAADFIKQGVPAEVIDVNVKGKPWYRIRVSGFKTKQEAGSYASRVKKSLNLSTVWVTKKK